MMYFVQHEEDLSELPQHWVTWYMHVMQPELRSLYLLLSQPAFGKAKSPITDGNLASKAGASKSGLHKNLLNLEQLNFLSMFYDDDEHLTYVTVYSPPVPTSAEEARANVVGEKMKDRDKNVADELVKLWKRNWQTTFGEAYTAPQTPDLNSALRLIRLEPDAKRIREVLKFYWAFAHEGEHKTFAGFARDYDEYAAQKARLDRRMI